ncbi:MAG: glutathione binding-like protein [Gammaproteobacteria bacterium]|nr:glutathione binding-like protein [Gammaproteobacteria bacterium]
MDDRLNRGPFLVGDALTIADLTLYAYTHLAHERGLEMSDFPAVSAWLGCVAATERHVPTGA